MQEFDELKQVLTTTKDVITTAVEFIKAQKQIIDTLTGKVDAGVKPEEVRAIMADMQAVTNSLAIAVQPPATSEPNTVNPTSAA